MLAQIRKLIVEVGLKVGDRLPTECELCERFASSRSTEREAMRMLKAFGVVEVRPKADATIVDQRMNRAFDLFSFNVTEISRQTFDDIQGFRELIGTGSVIQIFAAGDESCVNRRCGRPLMLCAGGRPVSPGSAMNVAPIIALRGISKSCAGIRAPEGWTSPRIAGRSMRSWARTVPGNRP
ncbi:MAG: FadR/GntR family transcriptional regulator [Tabrizicola sp.]